MKPPTPAEQQKLLDDALLALVRRFGGGARVAPRPPAAGAARGEASTSSISCGARCRSRRRQTHHTAHAT